MVKNNLAPPTNTKQNKITVFLSDHPWSMGQKGARGAESKYRLMSEKQILGMADAIKALSAPNAHFYMWATNLTVEFAYKVMREYGFEPRSLVFWAKPRMTLGNYFRNAGEFILFGTKGSAPVGFKSQPNWFIAPLQDHSHKPEEFYEIVERMSGNLGGEKLELFARRPRHGWLVWGNEIDSDITLADFGYPVPSDAEFEKGDTK
jgi:N6-adenosine-specific RNA methylase IME4